MSINLKYIIYFSFFFILASLEPLSLVLQAEIAKVTAPIIRYLSVFLLIILFFLLIFSRLPRIIFSLIFSAALAFTIISFRVANHPSFAKLSVTTCGIILLCLTIIIACICIPALKRNKTPNFSLYFATFFIGMASPITQFVINNDTTISTENRISSYLMNEKPNIYLLNYDSLIPSELAKQYFQFDRIPYQAAIDKYYNELPNSLSFHVPTKRSINDVMRLGQVSETLNYAAFSGNSISLLGSTVKKNGYQVVTGFHGMYFGTKGPQIDKGLFPEDVDILTSVLCIAQRRFQKLQAGMVCEAAFWFSRIKPLLPLYRAIFGERSGKVLENWDTLVLESIVDSNSTRRPTLFFAATYKGIGHTSHTYDHNDLYQRQNYKDEFWDNSHIVERQLTEAAELIQNIDPNSILVIFGDHGTFLSRSVKFEDDPEFFIKDRHRVAIALRKNGHRCSNPNNLEFGVDYHTPARLVYSILNCLGNGKITDFRTFDEDETILKYSVK